MHFITPDIINQINSSDIPSESVEELWNSRIDQLEKNYDRIKDDLPKNVVKFIQSYDLTNRNVFCKSVSPLTDEHMFIIGNPDDQEILYIGYEFYGMPNFELVYGDGFSDKLPCLWLYDEFHWKKTFYEHHVIFSDGYSYVIPFTAFYLRKSSWPADE